MNLNLHKLNFKYKICDEISFDVIKRGPLLLLLIGIAFSSLIFAIELTVYLNLITFFFIKE